MKETLQTANVVLPRNESGVFRTAYRGLRHAKSFRRLRLGEPRRKAQRAELLCEQRSAVLIGEIASQIGRGYVRSVRALSLPMRRIAIVNAASMLDAKHRHALGIPVEVVQNTPVACTQSKLALMRPHERFRARHIRPQVQKRELRCNLRDHSSIELFHVGLCSVRNAVVVLLGRRIGHDQL